MDGLERRLRGSLQSKLSVWLSLTILGVAAIAGIFAFFLAHHEAEELQDDVLRQLASVFVRQPMELATPPVEDRGNDEVLDRENRVFVQRLAGSSPIASGVSADLPLALPADLVDGLQTVRIGNESYRILVRTLDSGDRLAVAQETEVRDEIARGGALLTLTPFLILVPILLLVVAVMVRKIFRPVTALADEIDQRHDDDLHPIVAGTLPSEILPFVMAINRLLRRVEKSMDAQRRFVGDAAHELRSPLTALSLQAERLAAAEMSAKAQERLQILRQGIERGAALLDQLLALARAQSAANTSQSRLSVQEVYRRVLEDLIPLAEAKAIDIGVASTIDAEVSVNDFDLMTLLKNLVGNAIRYTPAGGRVDLSVLATASETTLVIEDSGPGIPDAERERVFDPFYRVLGSNEIGSGLGLSIVRAIAIRLGATLALGFADPQSCSGLRVTVTFPAVANRGCE
ncbi:MAG: Sensor protein QseC [Candidatus Accumulibacter appositus]|uniref:histidine kinase n=1 Tax=Candidatus Accumulibacter appositus TaxID=1454003 RepID=A0A011QI89_9PROT|nr:ATP-binding protein [Accumulibacter sp.]EXI78549.1 MAG: Sensor protein QseC [Candidatus Accumulibacter appositus]HRF03590.1 ATP-binding protein [Accumulibacter sp.]